MGVTGPDQDIIVARSTMELWVGPENVSSYLTGVYDTIVADFQVLVWGDLPVGKSNSQIILTEFRNLCLQT